MSLNEMKIHVYLLCYNEQDIIGSIIEYYSTFCEKIFIMDNYSTDKSVEIAKSYPNVEIIQWASEGVDESLYVHMKAETYKSYSRIGGQYTKSVADWIISCDMDEVLYHPDIKKALYDYKLKGITVPQITGFDIVDERPLDHTKPLVKQYSNAVRAKGFDKRIVFSSDFNITYHHGCHPRGSGFDCMKRTFGYRTSNEFPLALLHYKHIGKRLLNSAQKNFNRMTDTDDVIKGRGKSSAVGHYYKNIVSKGLSKSPLLDLAKPLFDTDGKVLFSEFEPTTGEVGLEEADSSGRLMPDQVDFLRDFSIQLEKIDLRLAYKLMKFVKQFRPLGEGIRMKIEQYERLLKNS